MALRTFTGFLLFPAACTGPTAIDDTATGAPDTTADVAADLPCQCPSPPPCQKAVCIGSSCATTPLTDGTACDDGNACTGPDTCSAAAPGTCQAGPKICEAALPVGYKRTRRRRPAPAQNAMEPRP